MARPRRPLDVRFAEGWKEDPATGCWIWQRKRTRHGYGLMGRGGGGSNEIMTHRASWIIHWGPIPDGMHVLHECDNPPCCNPNHLSIGTHDDNMKDAARKGRTNSGDNWQQTVGVKIPRGKSHYRAAFSEADVKFIRESRGVIPGLRLAEKYGVSPSTISKLQLGNRWKSLPP